ncbi:hypothetical protein GCM10009826_07030 [Humibacillus xanthopallidus]
MCAYAEAVPPAVLPAAAIDPVLGLGAGADEAAPFAAVSGPATDIGLEQAPTERATRPARQAVATDPSQRPCSRITRAAW